MNPFIFLILGMFATFMVTLGGAQLWCALPRRRKPAAAQQSVQEYKFAA